MSPEKTELEVGKQVAVFPPHLMQVERDDTPELTQVPGPVSANWGRCEPRSPTPAEASLSTPLPVGGAKAQGRTPLFTLWPRVPLAATCSHVRSAVCHREVWAGRRGREDST